MELQALIALAEKHEKFSPMSSAGICLQDAKALAAKGDDTHARERALKSLAYSVGVFSPQYRKAVSQ